MECLLWDIKFAIEHLSFKKRTFLSYFTSLMLFRLKDIWFV